LVAEVQVVVLVDQRVKQRHLLLACMKCVLIAVPYGCGLVSLACSSQCHLTDLIVGTLSDSFLLQPGTSVCALLAAHGVQTLWALEDAAAPICSVVAQTLLWPKPCVP
jgi:hypothetical protein